MLAFKHYFINGGGTKNWVTLIHNGPLFSPEYIPILIPVITLNGCKYKTNPAAKTKLIALHHAKIFGNKVSNNEAQTGI